MLIFVRIVIGFIVSVWKEDDPPYNLGAESNLARRLYRLRRLENKRPGRFTQEVEKAYKEWKKEFDFNCRVDFF